MYTGDNGADHQVWGSNLDLSIWFVAKKAVQLSFYRICSYRGLTVLGGLAQSHCGCRCLRRSREIWWQWCLPTYAARSTTSCSLPLQSACLYTGASLEALVGSAAILVCDDLLCFVIYSTSRSWSRRVSYGLWQPEVLCDSLNQSEVVSNGSVTS